MFGLFLDWSSWIDYIKLTYIWFNFKLDLDKKIWIKSVGPKLNIKNV